MRLIKNADGLLKPKLALFLIIFLTASYTVTNDIISSALTIVLWLALAAWLLMFLKSFKSELMLAFAILVASMLISILLNGENLENAVSVVFSILVALLYVNVYDFETFKTCFVKVMKFLCLISLIGFALFLLFPSLNNHFVSYNAAGYRFSNLVFYVHNGDSARNMGMFWEPGAFQTFILIAMLIECLKEKTNIKTMLLFAVTIVTTFSTTGYLGMVMVFLLAFMKKRDKHDKTRVAITWILLAVLVFVYFNQDMLFSTSTHSTFGKLISFFEDEQYNSTSQVSSAAVRYYALTKPLQEFVKRPFFGCGYAGLNQRLYQYTKGMNTCTFVNWFAVYGIFFGGMMLGGFIKLARRLGKNWLMSLGVIVVLFIATMSENYVNSAAMILLAFYGYAQYFVAERTYEDRID